MHLVSINLLNFKSYNQVELEFNSRINCFVGNNGVGKTNMLDSIFYLSMCKSNFNSIDYQNIMHGKEFFVVQGSFIRYDKEEKIYCAVKKDAGKVFKRNSKEYSKLSDHIGLLPIVIISPADSSLILDGSDERRKYMNSVIAQYNHQYLDEIIKYNKLLANRNKLLKENRYNTQVLFDLLEVIDMQLDSLATSIYTQRLEFTERLTPIFQEYYYKVSLDAEKVELTYQSHLAEKPMLELLKESIEKDIILQYTTKGIHKDDLILTLNGQPIKREGSQGQQKTLLIALKLAQFNFIYQLSGIKPILLLDDIFDKLDLTRVEQFISLVAHHNFGQIFITDTNKSRLDEILAKIDSSYSLFYVENGHIELITAKE